MAVNKITNKQVVNRESVNRANEVSTKGTTIRGNRETTITPGNNFSENYQNLVEYIDNQNIFISGISNNQTEDIKWQIKKI